MKVLVLDANQRPTLAITRSLGRKGIHVVVADETEETLAGSSKYCRESFKYRSPYRHPDDFINCIKIECIKRDIKMVFPVTEITTYLVLKHRDQFEGIIIPFASFEKFELLSNKIELVKLAQKLNIPIPKTIIVLNNQNTQINQGDSKNQTYRKDQINQVSSTLNLTITSRLRLGLTLSSTLTSLGFPVVLKPFRSRIKTNNCWLSASVSYANSEKEFERLILEKAYFKDYPFLIQEYIKGEGRGVFALYNNGIPIAFFAHRRIREKPPSGGVSVLSESVEVDPVLKNYANRMLSVVNWHGPAMVEFKITKDGKPYLMEINARFWGSLQLAIDAGVDFPYMLYKMAIGDNIETINRYQIGIKSRWLLGDLDNLYLSFKNQIDFKIKIISLINFLNLFDKNTRFEINRINDPNPFLFELKNWVRINLC